LEYLVTITLARLRAMQPAELESLSGSPDLPDALQLVRDAGRDAFSTMQRLINLERDGKTLTARQKQDFDQAEADVDALSSLGESLERIANRVDRSRLVHLDDIDEGNRSNRLGSFVGSYRQGQRLGLEHRMTDYVSARNLSKPGESELSIGKYMRGMVTGDWRGADAEQRALAEGTLGAGGYMLPAPMAARVIDRARAKARVLQAGARTVPMESSTLKVPRLATDPTAAWHTENATITASDPTFDAVTLTAQTLAGLTTMSLELLEDTDVDELVTDAFASVFALKIDYAALYGTGTDPEPLGVKNTTGITTTSLGANGGDITADGYIDAVTAPWDSNYEPTGVIASVRTGRSLIKLKDADNNYVTLPEDVTKVPRYTTTQVPTTLDVGTATDTSDLFVADWTKMLVGIRHNFSVQVLRERYADTGSVGLLAWFRGDVALEQPAAFHVVTGATN
jgi:HK97 family phage major capsid protein